MKIFFLFYMALFFLVSCNSDKSSSGASSAKNDPKPTPLHTATPPPNNNSPEIKKECHFSMASTSSLPLDSCDTIVIHPNQIHSEFIIPKITDSVSRRCGLLLKDFELLELIQQKYLQLDPNSSKAKYYLELISKKKQTIEPSLVNLNVIGKVDISYDSNQLREIEEDLRTKYPNSKIEFATSEYVSESIFEMTEMLLAEDVVYLSVESLLAANKLKDVESANSIIGVYEFNLFSGSQSLELKANNKFYCELVLNSDKLDILKNLIKIRQINKINQNGTSSQIEITN